MHRIMPVQAPISVGPKKGLRLGGRGRDMGSKGPEYTNPSIVYQRDRGGHYNLHNLPILTSATLGKSFMHHSDKDPIIAVATAAGRGGIGILRLSFGKALEAQIVGRLFGENCTLKAR